MRITDAVTIPDEELHESFVHASGPGGQNVNKVSTAVQLRWDVAGSRALPPGAQARLLRLGGRRVTTEGVLILEAQRFRTRERNRQDARDRLAALVRRALVEPRPRRPTRPTAAAREDRLQEKRRRGELKRARRGAREED